MAQNLIPMIQFGTQSLCYLICDANCKVAAVFRVFHVKVQLFSFGLYCMVVQPNPQVVVI